MSRILIIARPFENNYEGTGEQAVAREIVNSLRKYGQNTVLDYPRKTLIKPYHSHLSILYYDYVVVFYYVIKSLLVKYDLILFNTAYQTGLANLFIRNRSTRYTYVAGFLFLHNKRKSLFDLYSKILYRHMVKSTKIITSSTENQEIFKNIYAKESELIPLGVNDDLDFGITKPKNKTVAIGYIGAYNARKRTSYLIDLVSNTNSHNLKFIFAGRRSVEFDQSFKKLGKKQNVKLLGEISDKQKITFFREIDYLYFPTAWEGFGMPLVESMKAKVMPVVNFDAVLPEIIKSRCLVINNTHELVKYINKDMKNRREFESKIDSNYEYAKTMFNWKNFSDYLLRSASISNV